MSSHCTSSSIGVWQKISSLEDSVDWPYDKEIGLLLNGSYVYLLAYNTYKTS